MTLEENYKKAAEAVSLAVSLNAEEYAKHGSSAYKALLTPREFHEEVYRLAATMSGWSVKRE